MMFSAETIEPNLSSQSIRVIAESSGINNLSDDAAEELSNETTALVKDVLKIALKFTSRGKRSKLTTEDVDRALVFKNIEPLYGFSSHDFLPFRFASGGGRELFFGDEKEIELNDIINSTNTKAPLDVTIKTHWLVIDGVQPAIPENPINLKHDDHAHKGHLNDKKLKQTEMINVRSMLTHDTSIEQQFYFKEVTEGAVGSDETKRMEALTSLATDTGLQPLVPRLVVFIAEGVKCNVVQHNLALLIYLMRMTKALCENPAVNLEKCLHDLLPAILSCILGNQLCARPEADNHWALREFAARVLIQVCKQYSNQINNLQTRLGSLLANCWKSETSSFSTLFGALYSLAEFGADAVKKFILPKLPTESERLKQAIENANTNAIDRFGADHLKGLLIKVLRHYAKTNMNTTNLMDLNEFRNEFGFYIGTMIYNSMVQPIPARSGFRPF